MDEISSLTSLISLDDYGRRAEAQFSEMCGKLALSRQECQSWFCSERRKREIGHLRPLDGRALLRGFLIYQITLVTWYLKAVVNGFRPRSVLGHPFCSDLWQAMKTEQQVQRIHLQIGH